MLTQKYENLDINRINEELEAVGLEVHYKRIDHARKKMLKLIQNGDILVADKVADTYPVEIPKREPKKPAKAGKTKEKPQYNFSNNDWNKRIVFVNPLPGVGSKAKVLGYDPDHKKFKVEYPDGTVKVFSERSVRFKAVDEVYRDRYDTDPVYKTESGGPSITNNDNLAWALKGKTEEELFHIAVENGLEAKWDDLANVNKGMRRMTIGIILRGMVRRGEQVTVQGDPIEKL